MPYLRRIPRAGCVTLSTFILLTCGASAADVSADQASGHVGENVTVCGIVASADYATHAKGQPTFLNLDKAYPHQIFTVVIWGSDRPKFGAPEKALSGKRICATGVIQIYRVSTEVILHEANQLKKE